MWFCAKCNKSFNKTGQQPPTTWNTHGPWSYDPAFPSGQREDDLLLKDVRQYYGRPATPWRNNLNQLWDFFNKKPIAASEDTIDPHIKRIEDTASSLKNALIDYENNLTKIEKELTERNWSKYIDPSGNVFTDKFHADVSSGKLNADDKMKFVHLLDQIKFNETGIKELSKRIQQLNAFRDKLLK